jgi:alpha-tubulin suppressor-like RCC1 family protein
VVTGSELQAGRASDARWTGRRCQGRRVFLAFVVALLAMAASANAATGARPIDVVVDTSSVCALMEDGSIHCWGVRTGDEEVLPGAIRLTQIPVIRAFDRGDSMDCGLDVDGFTWCWTKAFVVREVEGYRPIGLKRLAALPKLVSLSVGFAHICGIDAEHVAWCLGGNAAGELGSGGNDDDWEAAHQPLDLPKVIAISAGVNNTCAVSMDGSLYCWGTDRQRSRGFVIDSRVPASLEVPVPLAQVSNGRNFACGAARSGKGLVCVGSNIFGQLAARSEDAPDYAKVMTDPPAGVLSVSAGLFSACALMGDRSVSCWGDWNDEHIFEPRTVSGVRNVVRVSVEQVDVACALSASAEIWCWGALPVVDSDATGMFSWMPRLLVLPDH